MYKFHQKIDVYSYIMFTPELLFMQCCHIRSVANNSAAFVFVEGCHKITQFLIHDKDDSVFKQVDPQIKVCDL